LGIAKRAFGLASTSSSSLFLLQEPASSGETVTEETAWRLVPVYRAITMVSNDLGRLPVYVASGTARGMEPLPSPVTDILTLDANRYMGAFEFRRTMTAQCLRYGNAFAQIVRSGRGEVLELVPLLPTTVSMHVHQGVVSYRHSEIGELAADEILHIRAPGGDGLWGESPVRMAREALGLQKAMDKTAGALYRNAGVPKLAFVHPGPLSAAAQQSIGDSFIAKHAGAANAGRPLVLGEGMRVERINQTLEDQMFAASRDFGVQEVSRLFGVPVVYLSEHSRSTFASITELTRSYWDGCLAHWTAMWSDEVRRKLLAPGQRLLWDTRDLLKGSFGDQVSALRSAVEVGLLSQNEARERLGLNPVEGGDELLRPANTLSETDDAETDADPAADEDDDQNA
jgi:HK97 family phage portal protein